MERRSDVSDGAGTDAGHFVRLPNGVSLHYVSYGDESRKPLIFIPGWTCTAPMFRFQYPFFSSRYRTISYDPRSVGRSEKTSEGNTYRRRGNDLDAFIAALDLRSATLVGWSYGAYDMYAYVRDHGLDRVAGLVVLDQPPTCPVPAGDTTTWGEAHLTPDGLPRFLRRVIDDRRGVFTRLTKSMLGKPPSTPDDDPDVAWIVAEGLLTPDSVAVQLVADGVASDYAEVARSASNRVPTLVIAQSSVAEVARRWVAENMPKAAFAEIASHMAFYADPDSFNQRLSTFLNEVYR